MLRAEQYSPRQARTEEEVSSPAQEFTVSGEQKTSMELSWQPPAQRADCLSYYRVCYHALPTRQYGPRIDDGCLTTNQTQLSVTGLAPCNRYQFKLSAMTVGGLASPSVLVQAGTLEDSPGPVVNLEVTSTGQTSISLQWDAPLINPSCVQGYAHWCFVNSSLPRGWMGGSSSVTNRYTIEGLYSCTNYTCEVAAMVNSMFEHIF